MSQPRQQKKPMKPTTIWRQDNPKGCYPHYCAIRQSVACRPMVALDASPEGKAALMEKMNQAVENAVFAEAKRQDPMAGTGIYSPRRPKSGEFDYFTRAVMRAIGMK